MTPSHDPTQFLIEKAREGDREAFEALVESHRERLAALVEPRVGKHLLGRVAVEDILQETLTRAFASMGGFQWRGPSSFLRWLRTIAERVILEEVRRQGKQGHVVELVREPLGDGTSPSRQLRRDERFERLERVLGDLSDDHREVVVLSLIDGLPHTEIAERLGRSLVAVRKLLSRALDRLKDRFGDTESLRLPDRRLGETEEPR